MAQKKTQNQNENDQEVIVQKVKPYPFDIEILKAEGTPPIKGIVLKLTQIGFIMRTSQDHHFVVADMHKARFELPNLNVGFNEAVKVIKTYDTVGEVKGKTLIKSYLVEMHFLSLSSKKNKDILSFLRMIRQE